MVTRHHHDQRQRGDRHHARGPGRRHAGRDLLHGRDRRPAADRADACRRRSTRSTPRPATRPAYYMINCAHPTHFEATLRHRGAWVKRIRGIRANASRRSHAELNEAPDLDDGNPVELGAAVPRAAAAASADQRAGRLLRHRPPPRRGDLRSVQAGGLRSLSIERSGGAQVRRVLAQERHRQLAAERQRLDAL